MSEDAHGSTDSVKVMIRNFIILLAVSIGVGVTGTHFNIFTPSQATAVSVFLGIILGTLFFWNFRLAIAFLGLAVLVCTSALNIPTFVKSSSLEVILFLVGMMIIVGALRDLGFFTWIVQLIVSMPDISGKKFIAVTAAASALLACAVDEVTSIIFISTLVFQVCDRLKLNPVPYILICVLATNVGSSGTMMGNPVGIYIGTKGGLTFGDFMLFAFPIMLIALAATIAFTIWFFRKDLKQFDINLADRLARNLSLAPVVEVPYKQGLILLIFTIVIISLHHPLENLLGIAKNSVLIMAPLVCSGIVMILRPNRARDYVEREVDWWTLIFFMLLFAVAGTLEHTHVDQIMAKYFSQICGTDINTLVPFILFSSAIGSAFVDNVIFVAAFSPVIEQLAVTIKDFPLWWALLFGACFGGNITMIGSTANIVALGMLEKRAPSNMTFFQWFKIGSVAALIACGIAWGLLLVISPLMPDRVIPVKGSQLDRTFTGKRVILEVVSATKVIKNAPVACEKIEIYALNIKGAKVPVYATVSQENSALAAEILKNTAEGRFFEGILRNSTCGKFRILDLKTIHTEKSSAH